MMMKKSKNTVEKIIKNTVTQKTNERKMNDFLAHLDHQSEFAKELQLKKVNLHKDEGEIMENELHRNVKHSDNRHIDARK
jgi:hypothetical protein